MCSCYLIFGIFVAIFSEPVMSSWEFVVSTKGSINFYTSDWVNVTSAAHKFNGLSAIAFDEIEEKLYFNDQSHLDSTIFSLKLSPTDDMNHVVERIVKKTKREKVQGLALDPLGRTLYWTDAANGIIYRMNLTDKHEPSVFVKDLKNPQGIAIDVCRRKLYWTSANIYSNNSTIGRISLDDSEAEIIIRGLDLPRGIVVDQFSSRIFWVDDLRGDHFTVESANLDGKDPKTVVKNMYHAPFDIAVDESNVYWTDTQENAVWKVEKTASADQEIVPIRMHSFSQWDSPKGIINRNHFLTSQANNPDCKSVIDAIKNTVYPNAASTSTETPLPPGVQCLNNGHLDVKTKSCQCELGFNGPQCEIPICYNYCIQGTCHVTKNGNTQCTCNSGFSGERCEIDRCSNLCLHGGHCTIENNEPNCQCPSSYYGNRCENMAIKEMCIRFCNKEDVDYRGFDMETICNNCSKNGSLPQPSYFNFDGKHENTCKEPTINKTAIFVSCGVVISLALVYVIVRTIRHVYKPLRPRIKKTYVVRKNVTPLTSRPTTEHCEITIENCCNMNICDSPCFDPKVLEAEASKKEDKKTLIHHSEDLMY